MQIDHITDMDSMLNWVWHNILNIFKKATKCFKNEKVINVEKVKYERFEDHLPSKR